MNPVEVNYHGFFKIMVDGDDNDVSKFLIEGNEYEPHVMPHFREKCFGTVLDIGANLGIYSLMAASLTRCSEVIAVEPNPKNCELLNISKRMQNLVCRIRIEQVAASWVSGFGKLSAFSSNGEICHGHIVDGILVWKEVLDNLIHEEIDVIKIDVEGHELKALHGAEGILGHGHCPVLFTEYYPRLLKNQGSDPIEYLRFLEGFGYRFFNLDRWTKEAVECHSISKVVDQYWLAVEKQGDHIAYLDLMCIS